MQMCVLRKGADLIATILAYRKPFMIFLSNGTEVIYNSRFL